MPVSRPKQRKRRKIGLRVRVKFFQKMKDSTRYWHLRGKWITVLSWDTFNYIDVESHILIDKDHCTTRKLKRITKRYKVHDITVHGEVINCVDCGWSTEGNICKNPESTRYGHVMSQNKICVGWMDKPMIHKIGVRQIRSL